VRERGPGRRPALRPLARRDPRAASDTVRTGLAVHWIDTGRTGAARVDLAEIEVRLHHARKPVARLTEWGDGSAIRPRHVESALTDRDPKLASRGGRCGRRGA